MKTLAHCQPQHQRTDAVSGAGPSLATCPSLGWPGHHIRCRWRRQHAMCGTRRLLQSVTLFSFFVTWKCTMTYGGRNRWKGGPQRDVLARPPAFQPTPTHPRQPAHSQTIFVSVIGLWRCIPPLRRTATQLMLFSLEHIGQFGRVV